jgi:RNA polymerase sigma factor (sigma-70 family)
LPIHQDWPALVSAIAVRRDRQAFAQIFDHFAPRLDSYLVKLGLDPTTAQEVCQDTMITLWNKADQFDPSRSSLGTWLYRIARNRRIDLARRDRVDYLDPNEPALTQIADQSAGPDAQIDGQRREDRVRAALAQLPSEQNKLIEMAFFDGLSHSEIAARTGLPLGTVKSRIRLAFSRLRRLLEAEGVADAGDG